MYVHELGGDRVVMRDNKLLICKTIEDAIIVEQKFEALDYII